MTEANVVVYAAGSLKDAFSKIGEHYEALNPGSRVRFTFASADHLRQRLMRGERADVFASANVLELERARDDGLVAGPVHVFAHNRLQIIVANASGSRVLTLADLARPGIRLAAEHDGAPLSGYTRILLGQAQGNPGYPDDLASMVERNFVVRVATVLELVDRVGDGTADAGIVYVTDVSPEIRDRVTIIDIPAELNVVADYAIGCVGAKARSGGSDDGPSFVSFVLGTIGQSVLERCGFRRGGDIVPIP